MKRVLLLILGCAFLMPLIAIPQDRSNNAVTQNTSREDIYESRPGLGQESCLRTSGGEPVSRVGGPVTAPWAFSSPDPPYTEAALKKALQGTVLLWLIVNAQGLPEHVKVEKTLDPGLDEKAVEAVKTWKFVPATKDGKPVAVMINVKVNFELH